MTKKTEGQKVREAFDGPKVEHDDLVDQIEKRMAEEYARSSDGGESAAKVTAFLEKTSINSQAFSWCKSIMKKLPKKDGQVKAMDVIRSMELILPMIKNHVAGQSTPDMLDGHAPGDEPANAGPEQEPETEHDADADPETDDDTADFNAAADAAEVDSTVTPIDFGGAAA